MINLPDKRRTALLTLLFLAVGGIAIVNMMIPLHAITPSSAETRVLTIIVSRYGFNGTASGFSITVQQGDSVKIAFVYGDNDLSVDNPHAIMIDGYRIQTVNIDRANPSVEVEFSADVSGTFNFYCYVPCLGMENLLGHLIVTPTQNQLTPTTLSLVASQTDSKSNSLQISASVKDQNGKPMLGIPVNFYENTTFGKLFIGTVKTDSSGVATLSYPVSRTGSIEIIAENSGNAQFASSSQSILVTIAMTPQSTEGEIYLGVKQPSQPSNPFYGISYPPNLSMIGVPRLMNIFVVALAGIIVLGVWSTYAYVGRQIIGITKNGERHQSERESILSPPIPEYISPVTPEEGLSLKGNAILAVLAPVLGIIDVLLVNRFSLSPLLSLLGLVGLTSVEAIAMVTLISSRAAEQ